MTTSKKELNKASKLFREAFSRNIVKPATGSELAQSKHSTTEPVYQAFATASKNTGAFESRYAKKRS